MTANEEVVAENRKDEMEEETEKKKNVCMHGTGIMRRGCNITIIKRKRRQKMISVLHTALLLKTEHGIVMTKKSNNISMTTKKRRRKKMMKI